MKAVLNIEDKEYEQIIFTMEALDEEQKGRLKPVYEALDEEYDYGLLKCVQASIKGDLG